MEAMAQEVVCIGSRVRTRDLGADAEFIVVSAEEADSMEGRLSVDSPLGRALLGRRAGDEVRPDCPDRPGDQRCQRPERTFPLGAECVVGREVAAHPP